MLGILQSVGCIATTNSYWFIIADFLLWQAVRMNKEKQLKLAVEQLIETSKGTPAEAAPLDVHCSKVKITFGDVEKKIEQKMCLLAFCGFHCRLDFAQHLLDKGASKFLYLCQEDLMFVSFKR